MNQGKNIIGKGIGIWNTIVCYCKNILYICIVYDVYLESIIFN